MLFIVVVGCWLLFEDCRCWFVVVLVDLFCGCVLFVDCCLLMVVCCLLLVVRCLLFVVCCSLMSLLFVV